MRWPGISWRQQLCLLACLVGASATANLKTNHRNVDRKSGECDKLLVSGSFRQTVSEIFLKVDTNLECFCGDDDSKGDAVLADLRLVVRGCPRNNDIEDATDSSLFLPFHEDIVASKSTVQVVKTPTGTRLTLALRKRHQHFWERVFSGEARTSAGDKVAGKFSVTESDQSDADDEIDVVQSKWIRPLAKSENGGDIGADERAYSTCTEFLEAETNVYAKRGRPSYEKPEMLVLVPRYPWCSDCAMKDSLLKQIAKKMLGKVKRQKSGGIKTSIDGATVSNYVSSGGKVAGVSTTSPIPLSRVYFHTLNLQKLRNFARQNNLTCPSKDGMEETKKDSKESKNNENSDPSDSPSDCELLVCRTDEEKIYRLKVPFNYKMDDQSMMMAMARQQRQMGDGNGNDPGGLDAGPEQEHITLDEDKFIEEIQWLREPLFSYGGTQVVDDSDSQNLKTGQVNEELNDLQGHLDDHPVWVFSENSSVLSNAARSFRGTMTRFGVCGVNRGAVISATDAQMIVDGDGSSATEIGERSKVLVVKPEFSRRLETESAKEEPASRQIQTVAQKVCHLAGDSENAGATSVSIYNNLDGRELVFKYRLPVEIANGARNFQNLHTSLVPRSALRDIIQLHSLPLLQHYNWSLKSSYQQLAIDFVGILWIPEKGIDRWGSGNTNSNSNSDSPNLGSLLGGSGDGLAEALQGMLGKTKMLGSETPGLVDASQNDLNSEDSVKKKKSRNLQEFESLVSDLIHGHAVEVVEEVAIAARRNLEVRVKTLEAVTYEGSVSDSPPRDPVITFLRMDKTFGYYQKEYGHQQPYTYPFFGITDSLSFGEGRRFGFEDCYGGNLKSSGKGSHSSSGHGSESDTKKSSKSLQEVVEEVKTLITEMEELEREGERLEKKRRGVTGGKSEGEQSDLQKLDDEMQKLTVRKKFFDNERKRLARIFGKKVKKFKKCFSQKKIEDFIRRVNAGEEEERHESGENEEAKIAEEARKTEKAKKEERRREKLENELKEKELVVEKSEVEKDNLKKNSGETVDKNDHQHNPPQFDLVQKVVWNSYHQRVTDCNEHVLLELHPKERSHENEAVTDVIAGVLRHVTSLKVLRMDASGNYVPPEFTNNKNAKAVRYAHRTRYYFLPRKLALGMKDSDRESDSPSSKRKGRIPVFLDTYSGAGSRGDSNTIIKRALELLHKNLGMYERLGVGSESDVSSSSDLSLSSGTPTALTDNVPSAPAFHLSEVIESALDFAEEILPKARKLDEHDKKQEREKKVAIDRVMKTMKEQKGMVDLSDMGAMKKAAGESGEVTVDKEKNELPKQGEVEIQKKGKKTEKEKAAKKKSESKKTSKMMESTDTSKKAEEKQINKDSEKPEAKKIKEPKESKKARKKKKEEVAKKDTKRTAQKTVNVDSNVANEMQDKDLAEPDSSTTKTATVPLLHRLGWGQSKELLHLKTYYSVHAKQCIAGLIARRGEAGKSDSAASNSSFFDFVKISLIEEEVSFSLVDPQADSTKEAKTDAGSATSFKFRPEGLKCADGTLIQNVKLPLREFVIESRNGQFTSRFENVDEGAENAGGKDEASRQDSSGDEVFQIADDDGNPVDVVDVKSDSQISHRKILPSKRHLHSQEMKRRKALLDQMKHNPNGMDSSSGDSLGSSKELLYTKFTLRKRIQHRWDRLLATNEQLKKDWMAEESASDLPAEVKSSEELGESPFETQSSSSEEPFASENAKPTTTSSTFLPHASLLEHLKSKIKKDWQFEDEHLSNDEEVELAKTKFLKKMTGAKLKSFFEKTPDATMLVTLVRYPWCSACQKKDEEFREFVRTKALSVEFLKKDKKGEGEKHSDESDGAAKTSAKSKSPDRLIHFSVIDARENPHTARRLSKVNGEKSKDNAGTNGNQLPPCDDQCPLHIFKRDEGIEKFYKIAAKRFSEEYILEMYKYMVPLYSKIETAGHFERWRGAFHTTVMAFVDGGSDISLGSGNSVTRENSDSNAAFDQFKQACRELRGHALFAATNNLRARADLGLQVDWEEESDRDSKSDSANSEVSTIGIQNPKPLRILIFKPEENRHIEYSGALTTEKLARFSKILSFPLVSELTMDTRMEMRELGVAVAMMWLEGGDLNRRTDPSVIEAGAEAEMPMTPLEMMEVLAAKYSGYIVFATANVKTNGFTMRPFGLDPRKLPAFGKDPRRLPAFGITTALDVDGSKNFAGPAIDLTSPEATHASLEALDEFCTKFLTGQGIDLKFGKRAENPDHHLQDANASSASPNDAESPGVAGDSDAGSRDRTITKTTSTSADIEMPDTAIAQQISLARESESSDSLPPSPLQESYESNELNPKYRFYHGHGLVHETVWKTFWADLGWEKNVASSPNDNRLALDPYSRPHFSNSSIRYILLEIYSSQRPQHQTHTMLVDILATALKDFSRVKILRMDSENNHVPKKFGGNKKKDGGMGGMPGMGGMGGGMGGMGGGMGGMGAMANMMGGGGGNGSGSPDEMASMMGGMVPQRQGTSSYFFVDLEKKKIVKFKSVISRLLYLPSKLLQFLLKKIPGMGREEWEEESGYAGVAHDDRNTVDDISESDDATDDDSDAEDLVSNEIHPISGSHSVTTAVPVPIPADCPIQSDQTAKLLCSIDHHSAKKWMNGTIKQRVKKLRKVEKEHERLAQEEWAQHEIEEFVRYGKMERG